MAATQHFSSLICELKIIEAKNIQFKSKGSLFVRFYLPSSISNKASIGLNTQEISIKNDHVWNESFSLACCGIGGSIDIIKLSQQSLIFELWLRKKVLVLGASKLYCKGKISLKDILESPNMVFDKWVNLVSTRGLAVDGVSKSPKLKVEMRVGVLKEGEKKRPRILGKKWNECECKDGHDHGCSYDDYDVFALAAASEAF